MAKEEAHAREGKRRQRTCTSLGPATVWSGSQGTSTRATSERGKVTGELSSGEGTRTREDATHLSDSVRHSLKLLDGPRSPVVDAPTDRGHHRVSSDVYFIYVLFKVRPRDSLEMEDPPAAVSFSRDLDLSVLDAVDSTEDVKVRGRSRCTRPDGLSREDGAARAEQSKRGLQRASSRRAGVQDREKDGLT